MGWAQRKRRGGGPERPITIVEATLETGTVMGLIFSQFVNGVPWDTSDFETLPDHFVPGTVDGDADELVELSFGVGLGTQTHVIYKGRHPNILSPQVVPIT